MSSRDKVVMNTEAMAEQLVGYVNRIAKLRFKGKRDKEEIRRLYNEARRCGFNTNALHNLIDKRALELEIEHRNRTLGSGGWSDEINRLELQYASIIKQSERKK